MLASAFYPRTFLGDGFGFVAMYKVMLGLAEVMRELENIYIAGS
jgi:hypothetical protein